MIFFASPTACTASHFSTDGRGRRDMHRGRMEQEKERQE